MFGGGQCSDRRHSVDRRQVTRVHVEGSFWFWPLASKVFHLLPFLPPPPSSTHGATNAHGGLNYNFCENHNITCSCASKNLNVLRCLHLILCMFTLAYCESFAGKFQVGFLRSFQWPWILEFVLPFMNVFTLRDSVKYLLLQCGLKQQKKHNQSEWGTVCQIFVVWSWVARGRPKNVRALNGYCSVLSNRKPGFELLIGDI